MKRISSPIISISLFTAGLLALASMTGHAQSSGPIQPEFAVPSAPAGAQVNTFTGGFSFGIPVLTVPGPHGSDYTINLSYHAGASPEQGASWVGYGWSLNPGAIVRDVRGFPDDWKDEVKIWNKTKRHWTVSGSWRGGIEAASDDLGLGGGLAYGQTTSYDSETGYRRSEMAGVEAKRIADYTFINADGQHSWSFQANPSLLIDGVKGLDLYQSLGSASSTVLGQLGQFGLRTLAALPVVAFNSLISPNEIRSLPTSSIRFSGESDNYGDGLLATFTPGFHFGIEGGKKGNYTYRVAKASYPVQGVGLMYADRAGASDLLDYSSEKSAPYRPEIMFLPIPFANADNFFATGGAMGGFRLHSQRSGVFRPDYIRNEMEIDNAGQELAGGAQVGVGLTLGLGKNVLAVSQWEVGDLNAEYRFDSVRSEESHFFRFGGDLGGNVFKAHSDNAMQPELNDDSEPKIPEDYFALMNEGERSGRSTYVGFNRNRDLLDMTSKPFPFRAFDKRSDLNVSTSFLNRQENTLADQIGEFSIVGAGGSRFNYSLPVYARAEQRLNYGVEKISTDSASRIQAKHLVYSWTDTDNGTVIVGDERQAPYAAAYLLTAITTPDYIDVTNNGLTPDDIGGYVKFNYSRTAGTSDKSVSALSPYWYHWRTPYRGLYYGRNQLSNPGDDMGSFTAGEREQYYLESVETKTHIAIFVNNKTDLEWTNRTVQGSMTERRDGYQAPYWAAGSDYDKVAAGDSTITDATWLPAGAPDRTLTANISRRLERIELYTRDGNGNPDSLLSTVFFEYDYSLRQGMPNSAPVHKDSTSRPGMLTLRRLWSQSQGIYSARISPYEFGYEYRTSSEYPAAMRSIYPGIVRHGDSLSASEQNPSYSPFDLDRWGFYQTGGAGRYALERPWVNQAPDSLSFDPAAWQLKWIRTPSEGELHVQYEQKDYSYVQDKSAMAMVTLKSSFGSTSSTDSETSGKYYLNMTDLGIADTNRGEFLRYVSMLKKSFVDERDRIYLRFLYALIGDTAKFGSPVYNSEYITAYARVKSVGLDSMLDGSIKRFGIAVELGANDGDYTVPKKVCLDLVKWNKRGRLAAGHPVPVSGGASAVSVLINRYSDAFFNPGNHCKAVDYANSYLRIPILAPKKGGGIRVKRLLTLDRGTGRDTALFGTEYLYQKFDEQRREFTSSGVAVNEPVRGREENALVNVDLARNLLTFDTKIIAGEDRMQYEGPLGESLLPAASVGYARIVVKNIHSGRTNPGFGVHEYFTTREYPYIRYDSVLGKSVEHTAIGTERNPASPLWTVLSAAAAAGGFEDSTGTKSVEFGVKTTFNDIRLTQGYRFILNGMHGQAKSVAVYGGIFEDRDSWALSALTEHGYYAPGEKVPVVDRIGDTIRYDHLGKEMEIAFESRAIEDHSTDVVLHGDVSMPPIFPPPSISVSGSAYLEVLNNDIRTHVATKVIRYPAIRKGTLTYGDGVYHMAENVAFHAATGSPVISRTVDGYDRLALQQSPTGHLGSYHSYAFPVTQAYPALGQKGINARAMVRNEGGISVTKSYLGSGKAKLTVEPKFDAGTYAALAKLFPGDLVRLTKTSDGASAGFYHIAAVSENIVSLLPVSPTEFDPHNTFAGTVNLEVIESGRTNQIGGAAGSVVTYGENPTAVRAGSNFVTMEPSGFSTRRIVVDTLNAVLNRGGGLIPPAALSPGSIKFLHALSLGGDTCKTLGDTIRLKLEPGRLVLSRGAFAVDDSIAGTPGSPHPLVHHLNDYLDSTWGHHIDAAVAHASECDSADYTYRRYNTQPASYNTYADSMFAERFDCVNFLDDYWIGDLMRPAAAADTIHAFRLDPNSYYSAMGTIDLRGIINGDRVMARYRVSECDTATGDIEEIIFERSFLAGVNEIDTAETYTTRTVAQIDGLFPYTSEVGEFGEDSLGYLTYTDTYDASPARRVFAVRFFRSDTTATRLVCSDTLVNVGGNGRFEISDDGSIIFVSADQNVATQPIDCLEPCPAVQPRFRTVSNVIAAGAAILGDSMTADDAAYPSLPDDGNAYERGTRGKWRPQSNYIYRTSIIAGSRHNTTERSYKNAGTFASIFKLFNWTNAAANDSARWMKSDSVTKYSSNGEPLETRSPLGIHGATKLGYNNLLPVIGAYNARYDGIAFSSFEDESPQTSTDSIAHAGNISLAFPLKDTYPTGVKFKLTEQLRTKGLLVKLWVIYPDVTLPDTGSSPLGVKFKVGGTETSVYDLRSGNRIARTGEWTLFELTTTDLQDSVGTEVEIMVVNDFVDLPVFVDDIKVQPVDASAVCYVYDRETFRPLTVFDDDHFGMYTQYNAEGRAVRTIIETERGIRTVAEMHGHLPMKSRDAAIGTIAGRESGGDAHGTIQGFRSRGFRLRGGDPQKEGEGVGGKVDLLDVELSPEGPKVKVLGGGKPELPDPSRLNMPDIPAVTEPSAPNLDAPSVPDIDGRALIGDSSLIEELKKIEGQRDALVEQKKSEISEIKRREIDVEMQKLEARKEEIVKMLEGEVKP